MKALLTSIPILILSTVCSFALFGSFASPSGTITKSKPNSNPPVITTPPISQIVTQGSNIRLSVIASNSNKKDKVLNYQWYKNNSLIVSATNYYMDFTNIQHTDQALYTVTVTNSTDGTAAAGSLTVPTTNILTGCIVFNTVNLSWSYDYTNNPDLDFFQIFYGTNGINTNGQSQLIVNKTNTNVSIHNLLSDNTYYFMAQAVSTNGVISSPSPQLSQTFGYFCGVPYTVDIVMLTNNVPRLTSKLCPSCIVGVQRNTDLTTTNWVTIGAVPADQYGNILFDDYNAPPNQAFYRLVTQ